MQGYPVSPRKSLDEALFEEARSSVLMFGPNAGVTIAAAGGTSPMQYIPNFNPRMQKIIRARTNLQWSSDKPVFLGGAGRSQFTNGDPVYTSSGGALNGELVFESDICFPTQGLSLVAVEANTFVRAWGVTSYDMVDADFSIDADESYLWIGDSVSEPTVNADLWLHECYQQIVKVAIAKSKKARIAKVAVGGKTSSHALTMLRENRIHLSDPKYIFFQFGLNDRGQSIPVATYKNNLKAAIRWKQYRYPNARMVLVSATPVANNTAEAQLVAYRAACLEAVTEVADALTVGVDMTDCFDRTLGYAIWASSDADPANGIHPGTALAHQGLASRIIQRLTDVGWI